MAYDGMNNGVESIGVADEFGVLQHQICTHIPGATDVQHVLPWIEEDDGTTKYEQFVDGVTKRYVNNVLRTVQEKTEIRKTVKEGNTTRRYHAIDFWENRYTAKYVPICHTLAKDKQVRLFD